MPTASPILFVKTAPQKKPYLLVNFRSSENPQPLHPFFLAFFLDFPGERNTFGLRPIRATFSL